MERVRLLYRRRGWSPAPVEVVAGSIHFFMPDAAVGGTGGAAAAGVPSDTAMVVSGRETVTAPQGCRGLIH